MNSDKTVVIGMSGGVDSAVSALLLKREGYNVIGLFMNNWEEKDENGVCSALDDYEDVKRVCTRLNIPYYSVNFAKEYLDKVFKVFLEEYKKGRTPNPDVLCNREIKFGPFLEYAKKLGADYIATGHYAKVEERNGKYYLKKAKDKSKDQSYFLNQLSQDQLKYVLFPLADIEKKEVREIALENALSNAKKKDSTGICFIGERNFRQFLQGYLPSKKGNIVDTQGNVVGTHEGVLYYTLGQRKGLNIGGKSGGNGKRWFVLDKDVKNKVKMLSYFDSRDINRGPITQKTFEDAVNHKGTYNNRVYERVKQLIKVRKQYPVITRGSFVELKTKSPEVFAYVRATDTDRVVVINNLSNKKIKATVIFTDDNFGKKEKDIYLKNLLTDKMVRASVENKELTVRLNAYDALWLKM